MHVLSHGTSWTHIWVMICSYRSELDCRIEPISIQSDFLVEVVEDLSNCSVAR